MSVLTSAAMTDRPQFLRLLREDQVSLQGRRITYEREGTELVSRGSVTLPTGGRWSAVLEVRIRDDRGALLTVTRTGPGAGPAPSDASLMIPPGEADAFLTLVTGLVEQAGADGVVERRPRDKSRRRASSRTAPPDAPASTS
jgi:hypothetical protein